LVHPVQCFPQVTANPAVGKGATRVSVQVSVTCTAETYNAHMVQLLVNALLGREATTRLGRAYVLQGQITSSVSTVNLLDGRRGVVRLDVQAESVWVYQLSETQLHALPALIAGKREQDARAILLRMQGIHQVTIASTDWWDSANQQTLPRDPGRMKVLVISWGGS
jgi:hypothetical protein